MAHRSASIRSSLYLYIIPTSIIPKSIIPTSIIPASIITASIIPIDHTLSIDHIIPFHASLIVIRPSPDMFHLYYQVSLMCPSDEREEIANPFAEEEEEGDTEA